MCWYEINPLVKWFSSSDVSTPALGLTCERVDHPPQGESPTGWHRLWSLVKLIERYPWE